MTKQEFANVKRHLDKLIARKHRTISQSMRETLAEEIAFFAKIVHDEAKRKRKQNSGGQ